MTSLCFHTCIRCVYYVTDCVNTNVDTETRQGDT